MISGGAVCLCSPLGLKTRCGPPSLAPTGCKYSPLHTCTMSTFACALRLLVRMPTCRCEHADRQRGRRTEGGRERERGDRERERSERAERAERE